MLLCLSKEKNMKKLSKLFGLAAISLFGIMCVFVTYNCTALYYCETCSAPWTTGLIFMIPFALAIISFGVLAVVANKKSK